MKGQPFKKLFGLVKQVAPTVLTAMGQPVGAALLRKALGGPEGADVEKLVEEASMTPEGIERLRLAEIELQKFESEKGVKFAELDVEDRKSARELATATGIAPQVVLSTLFIGGYFVILGLFFSAKLIVPMSEAFMVMLGVLTAGVPQILNFWLGSSRGSQSKDSTIAALGAK